MVDLLKQRIRNPFFISAVAIAVLFYCDFLHVENRGQVVSLNSRNEITSISGSVVSNPSITSSGKFYKVDLSLLETFGVSSWGSLVSSSSGIVTCLVPTSIIEALYPGRLYSDYGGYILAEVGEKLRLTGSFKNDFFLCSSAEYLGWDEFLWGNILHFRAKCRLKFKRLMYGWGSAGGFILALLSGSREYTEKDLSENFRKAGLSHILALSGMHLSFFAGLAGSAGKKLLGRKFVFWLRIAGILFFVWFAGISPSLLRALICSLIMLLCSAVFSLEADYFLVMCASFVIHVFISPSDMFSVAFILSYGALTGILLFGNLLDCFICRFIPTKVSVGISSSVGAQIATAPVSIVLFGTLVPGGIIASACVSPFVSGFMTLAVAGIFLSLLMPFLSPVFCFIMNKYYTVISVMVDAFALIPSIVFKER